MSAPAEGWTRLDHPGGNPIDADPDGVNAMGDDWSEIADAIGQLSQTAQRTQDSQDMQSDAFDETKKKGAELVKKLADYESRYEQAASAARAFYTSLEAEIAAAESAATKAAQLDKLDETETKEGSDKATPTGAAEDQKALLEQYKRDLQAAVDDAQAAADTMESAINDAKKSGKDTCMDKFKAFLKKILKVLMIIGMILSVIGLLIPGLNVIMIMGLIVDIMTMVFTAISFAVGQSTLLDLVMSIVGVGLGVFSAFRSLKGLKVDAEYEGYAGAGKLRNGKAPETGGDMPRPIEMPSWKTNPARAKAEAAEAVDAQRAARSQQLEKLFGTRDRLAARMDELRNRPLPSVADRDAVSRLEYNLRSRGHVGAAQVRNEQQIADVRSSIEGASAYVNRMYGTSGAKNAVNYFFTKDWMRLNRFRGRTGWLLTGAGERTTGEVADVMTSAAGAPKAFPTSIKDTLWHGFLDRVGFRESRGFFDDTAKFQGRVGDDKLTQVGDLFFKADGRVVRPPAAVLDPKNPGSLLGGATERVGWPFGNHDYLLAINSIDSVRKIWGLTNSFGGMWEYGSPGNYFDPSGNKVRQLPWNEWKLDHPGNPNWETAK